jgi:hypothetical protein
MATLDALPLDGQADTASDAGGLIGISIPDSAHEALRQAEEWLAAEGERQRHMHMPSRMFGECEGARERRGGPRWSDLPDVLPLGEEDGRAIEVINWWLKDESPMPSRYSGR